MKNDKALKLENQVCFPVYAASRLITRLYNPYLDELGITYPQYLVMLLLWEEDGRNVSELSKCLYLESNTLTPLLKRLESAGLIERTRKKEDERNVIINLTKKGNALKENAREIPGKILAHFAGPATRETDIKAFKMGLEAIIKQLSA